LKIAGISIDSENVKFIFHIKTLKNFEVNENVQSSMQTQKILSIHLAFHENFFLLSSGERISAKESKKNAKHLKRFESSSIAKYIRENV
jgi:hypothetical protein